MAGSQLTQLKSALTNAGLGRKSFSKKEKKAFKKGGARETDRAKTLQKLEDIKRGLNKFDHTETKLKHDVGGRQLKGVTGNPSTAKQAGLEKRKAQLLTEHQSRDHRGTFQDRRFGEADPNMTLEDRMLERYTRERQRGQGKKGLFNLEEGDDDLDDMDDGNALGGLTHGGRSVLDLPGDDFMLQGLDDPDDPEEKHIDRRTVQRNHFGGFQGEPEEEEELPERKKSKQEVMAEVMAKSKSYKAERQHQNDLDADLRDELDGDINDLRALLNEAPAEEVSFRRQPVSGKDDAEYGQFVRELAFEARAKPKDRTKTEDELAIEEKERLEKAEAKRLRRMRGEESEDEDSRGKKRKVDDRREADDLGDDFLDEDEEDLLGPGLTREGLEKMGAAKAATEAEEDDEEDGDEDDEEDGDEGDGEDGSDVEDEDEDEDDEEEPSDMDDLDEESDVASANDEIDLVKKRKRSSAKKTTEIPYTFICPATIDEFEDVMEPLDDSAIPTVVQRIRAIHHPSLAQGNKEKLQEFFGVLLDYTLVLAARPNPAFSAISSLVPHLVALVKMNPITAAGHFIEKITLMQKNLTRGLARGATRLDSKTYPGAPELVILRLIGSLWSTSDFSHPVVAPAVLLMGQYLSHGRIRKTSDIASGLMICSLLVQFESESKRHLPEAINFLAGSIVALLPRRKDSPTVPFPDLVASSAANTLHITTTVVPAELADLATMLSNDDQQSKADLLSTALRLIETVAALYSSSPAFIEGFQPMLQVIQSSRTAKLSDALKSRVTTTAKTLSRMLNLAITSRQPLALQSHKPVPIASHAPRFEEGYQPGKRYDPDVERNAASKLKAQYKQERKGAIRELRKDNRFLAGEKAKDQAEKDREYNAKMRRAEGSITVERAEEKEMEREKAREKRRAGRG